MIRFQCDYAEGAHPKILERLAETNYCQTPGYGMDEFCDHARAMIKEACEAPASEVHFLVGGTQTNATVISSILRPYQGVLCASTGHIAAHETGAIEHTGHKVITLPSYGGKIKAQDVQDAYTAHWNDGSHEHIVQPAMVYISFPTEFGTIYSKSELEEISAVCRRNRLPLFIDGARLGYGLTCDACDVTLPEIARLCDVFYIGGTKQGALFGEAVVFTNSAAEPYADLSDCFRYNIKQNGGMLAKGRLLGIQYEVLFEKTETGWLYTDIAANANRHARTIREALVAKGIDFHVDSPTNQIFPILTTAQMEKIGKDFAYEVWQPLPDGRTCVRFCTSWATKAENVDALVKAINEL